jgi:hypothetical protein
MTKARNAFLEEFPRAASSADYNRTAASHSFDHDHAKRLGLCAGMHDDIERTHDRATPLEKTSQENAVFEVAAVDFAAQFIRAELASSGTVDGAADDVGPPGSIQRKGSQRVEKSQMTLPSSVGSDQTEANGSRRRSGDAGGTIQILGLSLAQGITIHGVINPLDPGQAWATPAEIFRNAVRVGKRPTAATRQQSEYAEGQRSPADVVVDVPQNWRDRHEVESGQYLHLHACCVDQVRL